MLCPQDIVGGGLQYKNKRCTEQILSHISCFYFTFVLGQNLNVSPCYELEISNKTISYFTLLRVVFNKFQ